MKKTLLFAGLAALAFSASAQHPFAYNLHADGITDHFATGKTITVNYTLNADAVSGSVKILEVTSQGQPVAEVVLEGDQLTKGTHAVEISVENLAPGVDYGYVISTTGAATDTPKEVFSDFGSGAAHTFWSPYGLAIDNDPESKHFGRVLVTETQSNQANTYFAKAQGVGAGLYEFDPQGNPVTNGTEKYGYNPFQWVNGTYKASGQTKMFAKKVRIAQDGRIFLGVLDCVNNPIYTINPDNLGDWSPVFQGTLENDSTGLILDADNKMVAAPSAAFDVVGSGSNLKLVNLGSKCGQTFSYGNYTCYEYPLGNAKTWSTAVTADAEVMPFSLQYTISAQSVSVAYEQDGKGIWYVQYRGAPTDAQPAIKHATFKDGAWEEDYSDITTVARGGGVAFNKDYTLLAIPAGNFKLKVYEVGKDGEGKPTLTVKYDLTTTSIRGFNDICFDYANNIYACDNGKEVIQQIQLPIAEPTAEVQCRIEDLFSVSVSTGVTDITTTEVKAQKVIENGQVVIVKGDKKYNTMGAEIK